MARQEYGRFTCGTGRGLPLRRVPVLVRRARSRMSGARQIEPHGCCKGSQQQNGQRPGDPRRPGRASLPRRSAIRGILKRASRAYWVGQAARLSAPRAKSVTSLCHVAIVRRPRGSNNGVKEWPGSAIEQGTRERNGAQMPRFIVPGGGTVASVIRTDGAKSPTGAQRSGNFVALHDLHRASWRHWRS